MVARTFIAFALLASAAGAEPPERQVALILEPARKADADKVAQLTQLMEAELTRRGIGRAHMTASFDPLALAEGRALLGEAYKMLGADHHMLRAAETEGVLTRALLGLKSSLGTATVEELADVYLGLAGTRHKQGDERLAREYMLTAIHLGGLDDQDFFGYRELRDLHRRVKAELATLATGSVEIDSKPRGAEVYLADEFKGYTPMTLTGLPEGTHLVRIRREGFYAHGFLATVTGDGELELRHTLKPMGGRAQLEKWLRALHSRRTWRDAAEVREAADGVRRLMKADDLVVARLSRTRKGYRLRGAVAPRGGEPERLDLDLALDASLLDKIRSLVAHWVPAGDIPKPTAEPVPRSE